MGQPEILAMLMSQGRGPAASTRDAHGNPTSPALRGMTALSAQQFETMNRSRQAPVPSATPAARPAPLPAPGHSSSSVRDYVFTASTPQAQALQAAAERLALRRTL